MTRTRPRSAPSYVGKLERDCDGVLWAVLYAEPEGRNTALLSREIVRSPRHGRRRVTDLVLAEADAANTLASPGWMR